MQAKGISKPDPDANGEWKSLHNEELQSSYRSPNIVWVIKSRRLRWEGRVENGRKKVL